MTDIKTIEVREVDPVVTSAVFNAAEGWDYVRRLAIWCGGNAYRDESPGQSLKTYYWSIYLYGMPDVFIGKAVPGDIILKHKSGRFSVMKPGEFGDVYTFKDSSGVMPCFFSIDDAKYHRKTSNYSDLRGYARCSLVNVDLDNEDYTNNVSPASLCPKCWGSW